MQYGPGRYGPAVDDGAVLLGGGAESETEEGQD